MPDYSEEKFRKWYTDVATLMGLDKDPDKVDHYYDYRGFYKKYAMGKEDDNILEMMVSVYDNPNAHLFTDEFKLPGHPTFSNESVYNDPGNGVVGGHWENDSTFVPSDFNLMMQRSKRKK